MSERPKKSRNRKQDVQLVVSCGAPKAAVAEGRSTSVYEIDIQGGYDLFRRDRRGCMEKNPKETSTRTPAKELQGACQEKAREEVEGHLEAHYPKIMETFSSSQRSPRSQNASFIVQRDILTDENKEKERKPFMGKTTKKRQAMPADAKHKFGKQIKNYIVESFIGDKCRDMQSLVQNYHGVLDGNEVHLHHHEHHHHHHHYYTNGKKLDNEANSQTVNEEDFAELPEIFVATVTANTNGAAMAHQGLEVENSNLSNGPYATQAPGTTEETQEQRSDLLAQGNLKESDALLLDNGSLSFVEELRSKIEHNSTSSLKSRIGEIDMTFIKNAECSLDSVMIDNTEIRGMKEEKGKSIKSYTSLMENFKNFNNFTSPIVITDQQSVPKILYIRCDCSPWKGVGSAEEVENNHSRGRDDFQGKTDDGEDKKQTDPEQIINPMPTQCQGVGEDSSEELAFEVWTSKLKKELQEIKKELKRIEEKQVLEKRSTNTSLRKENVNESSSEHKITVYSSKTFIMQPTSEEPKFEIH